MERGTDHDRLREDVSSRLALAASGRTASAGFTLIELMIVAVVLAILAAAIIPNVVGQRETARRARAESDIAVFEGVLELFDLNMDRYPTAEEGLRVLYYAPDAEAENWKGPYLGKPNFKDPWGNDYVYIIPGTHSDQPYEIVSYGKDATEGGEGDNEDVHSWIEMEEG